MQKTNEDNMSYGRVTGKNAVVSFPTGEIRYGLTNDYLFHIVFQRNLDALAHLIALVLGVPRDNIKSVKVENILEPGKDIDAKSCVLDVKATMNDDTILDLEMQVEDYGNWTDRSLTYLCRMYDNLSKGQDYKEVKKAIHIGFLDYHLKGFEERFRSEYMMTEQKTGQVYSSKFQLFVIDLKTLDDKNYVVSEEERELYEFARIFKAKTWEEVRKMAENSKVIDGILFTWREATEEEKVQDAIEARRRYEWDKASARQMGLEEGMALGIEQGIDSHLRELVQKKLSKGKSVEVIADECEISVEEAERFVQEIQA